MSTHLVKINVDDPHLDGTPNITLQSDGLQFLPLEHREMLLRLLAHALELPRPGGP